MNQPYHFARFSARHATYFDRYVIASSRKPTVLMLHGGHHTGTCWQLTADGRPGWVSRFLTRGYPVVLPDWAGHGRSGVVDAEAITGNLVVDGIASVIDAIDGPVVLMTHSMGGGLGWSVAEKRIDRLAAVVGVAPGPPGNLQPAARIVEEHGPFLVIDDGRRRMTTMRAGMIVPAYEASVAKFIGSSTRFPRDHFDSYFRMLSPLAAGLVLQRLNLDDSQVKVADPASFAGKPVLVLTGSDDDAHPREVDEGIVLWLREAGAVADYIWLADHGIVGNGHMLMLEDNSDEIADVIMNWLDTALSV